MKSSIAERTLKGTGVTVDELGQVLGIQGATIDDINEKWETMDTDARAAALGQAAAMNEGEKANEEYKHSWEGLQAQIEIGKGRLERLAGEVFLPVLVPAMELAVQVLTSLGDTISWVMSTPLGGLVSILATAGGSFALIVVGISAVTAAMGFFTASLLPAITASWALIAPWAPFIAAAVLIVAAIYAIGAAFGWWDDLGGMLDAFYNNVLVPVYEFLVATFTPAWNFLGQIIQAIMPFVQNLSNAFTAFGSGQIDFVALIYAVMTNLFNIYQTVFNMVISALVKFGSQMLAKGMSAASQFVNNIVTRIKELPGKVFSALILVVARIVSAGQQWVNSAKNKAQSVVNNVYNTLTGLPGKIASALSGVASAITKPFTDAYDRVCKEVDKIKNKASELSGGWLSFGGDDYVENGAMAGVDLSTTSATISTENTVEHSLSGEFTVVHDLRNLPDNITAGDVARIVEETASSESFAKNLARNMSFQEYDLSVKQRITARGNRARGV